MKMFLSFNDGDINLCEMVMTRDIHNDYHKFMNVLMAPVYETLFQRRLRRVLQEMKIMVQSSLERRVGDWFLSKNSIVIRVYGYTHQLYVLPVFLTPRMFSLDLIKQRLWTKMNIL